MATTTPASLRSDLLGGQLRNEWPADSGIGGRFARNTQEDLIRATEADLTRVQQRVASGRLQGQQKIALAVGKVLNRFKVGKNFELDIRPGHFGFARRVAAMAEEAALDGLYVIETTVPAGQLAAEEVVAGYKSLRYVEQAFRSLKTMAHEVRPLYHRLEDRVRAHAFLCMLAYYVKWHMVRTLELLQQDQPDRYRSFRHVLNRLGAIQFNTVEVQGASVDVVTQPDEEQQGFLDCLGVGTLVP